MCWAAFFLGCARRGGARPCASYGSRAVRYCVAAFVHRKRARRQPLDVHREEEMRLPRTVFFERVSGHGEL